ncbi:MAG: BolA family transcriptional regulator [Thiothrix sp.]|nr:MAG: BolA family transcriptional regulator [Thiothrix sp.]
MSNQTTIEDKLNAALHPTHLEVLDESHMHSVPAGAESHFKVTLVTEQFENLPLIKQHRMINDVLKEELAGKIHALALHTYSPTQWTERSAPAPESPLCHGGGKA